MKRQITKAVRALRLLFSDPQGLLQKLATQAKIFLTPPKSGEIRVQGLRFDVDVDLDPVMKKMYHGDYEPKITALLERYLRPGDIVIDVGANVGYLSAYAMGLVGCEGEVHAFEPVPRYFDRLVSLKAKNPEHRFYPNRAALGEKPGTATVAVTNLPNIGWNTMVPGFMRDETIRETVSTPVTRLDGYLESKSITTVRLIKIDTEGYELPVLKGLEGFLEPTSDPPILIIEVAPRAYSHLEGSLGDLQRLLVRFRYSAYELDGTKPVDLLGLKRTTDVLLLPDWLRP